MFDYLSVNKEIEGEATSIFIQEYRKDYSHWAD